MRKKVLAFDLFAYQNDISFSKKRQVIWDIFKTLVNKLPDYWEVVAIISSNLSLKRGMSLLEELKKIGRKIEVELFDFDNTVNYRDLIYKEECLLYELALEYLVSQLNPSIYITSSFLSLDYPTSLGKLERDFKVVVILSELDLDDVCMKNKNLKKWYDRKIEELKLADYYYAVSEEVKKQFIDFGLDESSFLGSVEDLLFTL